MAIVRHYPETSPQPTESSFPGCPLGVFPPMISSEKIPRTKRDMVIAVCRVAPAHAIPDQDKDGKAGAGDQNWHGPTRKSPIFVPYRIYWSDIWIRRTLQW